jgi:hypothetical protein
MAFSKTQEGEQIEFSNRPRPISVDTRPAPTGGIVHRSSGLPLFAGAACRGEVVSIYGAGFGPQQGVAAKPSGNSIATELAGVQVVIPECSRRRARTQNMSA